MAEPNLVHADRTPRRMTDAGVPLTQFLGVDREVVEVYYDLRNEFDS